MAPSARFHDLLATMGDVHDRKNAGYAGVDNPDPWANFRMSEAFGISPLDGCLVRISDKYSRIANLRKNPANEQVNESIKDTLIDLANYAVIAICLLEEEHPTVTCGECGDPIEYGVPHDDAAAATWTGHLS